MFTSLCTNFVFKSFLRPVSHAICVKILGISLFRIKVVLSLSFPILYDAMRMLSAFGSKKNVFGWSSLTALLAA